MNFRSMVRRGIAGAILALGTAALTPAYADVGNYRFIASDQTIRDRQTGTTWARNGNLPGKELAWLDAQKYLKSMNQANHGGYSDWGFPSKASLEELLEVCSRVNITAGDRKSCAEILNASGFRNIQEGLYWSSSKVGRNNFFSLAVSTIDGAFKNISKEQAAHLLPVHGGR